MTQFQEQQLLALKSRIEKGEDAAKAHLATLRAPRDELAEARAELGALRLRVGLLRDAIQRVPWNQSLVAVLDFDNGLDGQFGYVTEETEAALSRARGEGGMTTPKRYEETADALLTGLGYRRAVLFTPLDRLDTANALHTAAKEAQLRVLDRVLLQCTTAGSWQEQRLLALKSRIENGEDL